MKVLVKPNGLGTDILHLPGDDDKPKCGENGTGESDWRLKDRDLYPNARLCKKCQDDYGAPGPKGPQLAAQLRRQGVE